MLRITRLTDYGFVLLGHIASYEESILHNSKDLSSDLKIPLPTVSKVLKSLVQAGLLESHQGSQGGYKLAKSSDQISAADIIEILEGPVSLTACCVENGCDLNCSVSKSWQEVNTIIVNKLKSVTLTDMLKNK
tara:strand:- start:6671 stop:7069 length:399 start_codon:yes stop_codon:yes gene_type:complete